MNKFLCMSITNRLKEKGFTFDLPIIYDGKGTYYHSVQPRISQVLDWLRDEKVISVEPCATPYNCWYYMIKCKGEIKVTYTGNKYRTYEEAAIAGIEYALDNLI